MIKRILELIDTTQPYCPGLSKQFSIQNKSGMLSGTFYLKDASKRDELESKLSEFEDILRGYEILDRVPFDEVRKEIALSNFEELERLMEEDLIRVFSEARIQQKDDAAYCFQIWLEPGQGGLVYGLSCEGAFQQRLVEQQTGPGSGHYRSEKQIQNYRFYEYATFEIDASENIRDKIYTSSERSYEKFCKYGNEYLRSESVHRFESMSDAASRALQKSNQLARETLLTTKDFVMFIHLHDVDDITHYRAARKTMTITQMRSVMGALYGDLMGLPK